MYLHPYTWLPSFVLRAYAQQYNKAGFRPFLHYSVSEPPLCPTPYTLPLSCLHAKALSLSLPLRVLCVSARGTGERVTQVFCVQQPHENGFLPVICQPRDCVFVFCISFCFLVSSFFFSIVFVVLCVCLQTPFFFYYRTLFFFFVHLWCFLLINLTSFWLFFLVLSS